MDEITDKELFHLASRKLFHGEYVATDYFRSIEKHTSVCFEDGGLVAVTGKAGDRESQLYAALFADAPAMLLEIARLRNACQSALNWLDKFGKDAPIVFGGEQELHDELQDALNTSKYDGVIPRKSPTPYYYTYANLEESGELIGFEPVAGNEEDFQAMKDDLCPNCKGECKLITLRNDIGILRVFSVCIECDVAREF